MSYWATFQPTKLPEQEKIDAVLRALRAMTPEEIHESSVRSGIHNPDGSLTKAYGGRDAL